MTATAPTSSECRPTGLLYTTCQGHTQPLSTQTHVLLICIDSLASGSLSVVQNLEGVIILLDFCNDFDALDIQKQTYWDT